MKNRVDLVIDLETFSTNKNAWIASIGVCGILNKTEIINNSHWVNCGNVNIENVVKNSSLQFIANHCATMGLDLDTIEWWRDQKNLDHLFHSPGSDQWHHINECLMQLGLLVENLEDKGCEVFVWGNGSSFDIAILEYWYDKLGILIPWKFWNVRDLRTIVELSGIDKRTIPFFGEQHNAVDDATHEAKILIACYEALAK